MALYTEETIKQVMADRKSGVPLALTITKQDVLTPSARSYLRQQHIELRLEGKSDTRKYVTEEGKTLAVKPEHMTHLKGNVLVFKDHPRIIFRGFIDALEAEILLTQLASHREGYSQLTSELGELLNFVRNFIRYDVLGEPMAELELCGLNEAQLREMSHHPEKYYGEHHFMADYTMSPTLLQVNRLRTLVRQTELAAYRAFRNKSGQTEREDIIEGLNRLSSFCWIVMIRIKAGSYKKEG